MVCIGARRQKEAWVACASSCKRKYQHVDIEAITEMGDMDG